MVVTICIAEIPKEQVVLFGILILLAFMVLFAYFFIAYFWMKERQCLSPYTGKPMRKGSDIPLSSIEEIMRYLYYVEHSYDNRIFLMKKSMVCRETGRIFSNCVSIFGHAKIEWTFLNEKLPGNWLSWGSLTPEQQQDIAGHHEDLEGYQTQFSSPTPAPSGVEADYAFAKPGPLYVDMNSFILMGWKCVPGTDFEVLVVQKPKTMITLSFKDGKMKKRGSDEKRQ